MDETSTGAALRDTPSSWVPPDYPMGAVVVIAASAGGLEPLRDIVKALRDGCKTSTFIVVHIGSHRSNLPSLLTSSGGPPASFAQDGEIIEGGRIYIAPPDRHVTLDHERIHLSSGPKVHYTRPAADPLFVSAAKHFGKRVVGIVLSGGNSDGAVGIQAIQDHGGTAFVQLPKEAKYSSMPLAAIAAARPDILSTEEIARRVGLICGPN
jgi:two-component system, chemotaxis family, protein-glutamate methylesterase/glutaminase